MRVCSVPGCPEIYDGKESRCPQHRAASDRSRGTATERGYNSAGHHAFRNAVLTRDPICVLCDIDLAQIAEELKSRPHLAQLALLRQPWFANEIRHGGVLEALEADGAMFTMNDGVIEHTSFFTGNPSVWSEAAYKTGWPSGSWTENKKRDELRIQGFAFGMLPEVRVHHVGQRTGFGY